MQCIQGIIYRNVSFRSEYILKLNQFSKLRNIPENLRCSFSLPDSSATISKFCSWSTYCDDFYRRWNVNLNRPFSEQIIFQMSLLWPNYFLGWHLCTILLKPLQPFITALHALLSSSSLTWHVWKYLTSYRYEEGQIVEFRPPDKSAIIIGGLFLFMVEMLKEMDILLPTLHFQYF